jgi:hypothetical protein
MKKVIYLIAIMAMTSACAAMQKASRQEFGSISYEPETVAIGIKNGIKVTDGSPVWEEYIKVSPSTRGPKEPAVGYAIYDLNGDGRDEHLFYQFEEINGKLQLTSLVIKTGDGVWLKGNTDFPKSVQRYL